jgi:hypothetical protein
VPCVDGVKQPLLNLRWAPAVALVISGVLASCSHLPWPDDKPPAPSKVGAAPATEPARTETPRGPVKLGRPASPRDWTQARRQAAERLVAANPHLVYGDRTPDVLLAIPVMSIELNADGSVRKIEVMRYPKQARDTVQLAMQSIHNAAPYGDVSRLPKPWRFNETFLFNDHRKFKPMTLDQR